MASRINVTDVTEVVSIGNQGISIKLGTWFGY